MGAESMYIHIPFCTQICHYCDFNKFYINGQPVEDYLDCLLNEVDMYRSEDSQDRLSTLFIGGGTPSALSEKQLEHLLHGLNQRINLKPPYEFTMEANPGDLTRDKLKIMKQAGVNRLSLGVQSFNEELLKKIGRAHTVKAVYETIEMARNAGFENISIDLIFSLPGQTMDDLKHTLDQATALALPHFSAYSLIIEPKTVFYILLNKGKLTLPGEDLEASMFEYVMERLESEGYKQYEISNFSKAGYESRHNITYWDNKEYYGVGAGAHGYLNGSRYNNHGPLKKYMNAINLGNKPVLEQVKVSVKEQMEEEMFLGLRKTEGVSFRQFSERFSVHMKEVFGEVIYDLEKRDLIEEHNGRVRLTKQGKFVGNEVFQSFLL